MVQFDLSGLKPIPVKGRAKAESNLGASEQTGHFCRHIGQQFFRIVRFCRIKSQSKVVVNGKSVEERCGV